MSLKLLLQLSWRNVFRQRRRNGILVSAICLAVAGVVLLNTIMRGMQVEMINGAIENLTGHVKVLKPGYIDDPGVSKSFVLDPGWSPELPPEIVAGWASRIRVPAVVQSERETRGIQLVGVDPAREGISFFSNVAIEGETLSDADDRRILIGTALAEQLETRVGKRLVIMTQGADGKNREAGYRIAGLYDADGTGLEKIYVFTGAQSVQNMLESNVVTEVSIRLTAQEHQPTALERLMANFTGLDVLTWQELEPQAAAFYVLGDTAIFIWFLIIMGALVFGLVNTLITAVLERTRELGMLRAVGMRPRAVVTQVVFESSFIMIVGVLVGVLLGIALYLPLADGIDLSAFAAGMEGFGVGSALLVPVLESRDIGMVVGMSLVLGILASFYPARRAVRIKPLEALRG
ncbi:MAG: ABC transporter permease [Gammaproteobacteria bacterium]|nr:ABC transporter permease [Gammaproteobacteria bacterium]